MKQEIKNPKKFCGIHYINMVDKSRKMNERNGIETIVDNDGILWLNKKRRRGIISKKFAGNYNKTHSNDGKHRHKPLEEPKSNAIEIL